MPKVTVDELAEIQEKTSKIESDRESKQLEREERRLQKELKKKRQAQEKMVAPILLGLTVIIGAFLYLWFGRN